MSEYKDDRPQANGGHATRRTLLRLGAIAVPAVVTLKPAFAATNSIMNCEIPIDNWVDAYGDVQAPNTQQAYAPPSRPYLGEEIRTMTPPNITLSNGEPLSSEAFNAHVEYIKKMQQGTPGFTCFASIAARRV